MQAESDINLTKSQNYQFKKKKVYAFKCGLNIKPPCLGEFKSGPYHQLPV